MADLKKLLTYLIEQLPNNKLLQVCDQIQPKKNGTNDYLSSQEFLENIWKNDKLRKIFSIEGGEKEDDERVDSYIRDGSNEKKLSEKQWEEVFKSENIGKDCRIKEIELEKFKYYPVKINDYLFGTTFVDLELNPKSALILGNNGVGKTSIYQAIEFSFRNQIGEVFLRDYVDLKEKEKSIGDMCKKYLVNKEYTKEEVVASIETVDVKADFNNPLIIEHKVFQKFLPNFFFISDYEIFKLGRLKYEAGNNNSLRMFMGESMDLGELIWFNRLMGKLSCYKQYPEIFDDKSEETEFINNERRNIKSYKEEIIKLYDQYAEIIQLIAELEKSKHNDISEFLLNFISAMWKLNEELDDLSLPNSKSLEELKEKIKEINSIKGSIKKENNKIKDQLLFKSLLDNNIKLYSFLDQIRKKINITLPINPEVFRTQCDEFINYLQLPQNIKYISSEYKAEQKNIFESIKNKTSSIKIEELIDKTIESTKRLSSSERNISIAEKNVEEIIFKNRIIQKINTNAKEIFEVINKRITNHFNESVKESVTIVDKVMKMFLTEKEELEWIDEDLVIDYDRSQLFFQFFSLKMNLKEKGENTRIPIKRYFNTFRYRMFSILLVISTSFAIMKKLNINFPIVIDDVFHANDFKHRNEIKYLIESIIVSHKKIFKDEPKDLQLIIFTHDDLIFNSIRKSILENNNNRKNDKINFGFYRLLDYEHAEKDDANKINNVLYEFK